MAERPRAAIYTRISRDSTGESAGVRRQEDECREHAAKLDLDVVEVFSDNDISAYSGKPRPGYQALLEAIESGAIDAVVCWHTDRLYRRLADLEGFIAVCQPRSVPTYAVQAGHLDLATPAGRMVARQLGAVAQYESEQKAERQRSANQQRARAGVQFITHRPFGYEPDGQTLRPSEADAVREAYEALLRGESVAGIARSWNELGLVTPQAGNPWASTDVTQLLRGPRPAGLRRYRGSIVTDDQGQPVRGQWPALVDLDTWFAAQAVLRDPRRRFPQGPKLLLSGVALYGVCGAKMQSGGTRNGRQRIRCSAAGGHPYREAAPIERLVTGVLLQYLARPDVRSHLMATDAHPSDNTTATRAELAALQTRSDDLVSAFTDGVISATQLREGQARIEHARADLERRLPTGRHRGALRLVRAADPQAEWDALDIDAQRAVINDLMVVRVLPTRTKEAAYAGRYWHRIASPDSIQITWRLGEVEGVSAD